MQESLLSHIASRFISQYENVANASIAYLLNNYKTARNGFSELFGISNLPQHFAVELAAKDSGRPDVTGIDENGNSVLIIEGKFWANLTSNQPNNYFNVIDSNGFVIFLAPGKRVESLKKEINERLGNESILISRVRVESWSRVIDAILIKNQQEHDYKLESDARQLLDLCNRMDVEGLPPLEDSDLDPMHGKITYQLADILDQCRELLRLQGYTDFNRLKATAWKLGYGFYFRGYGLTCQLCFSSQRWYTRESQTPIWLKIRDENWKKSNTILTMLKNVDPDNIYDDEECTSYAIQLKTGLDREELVNHIVNKVNDILFNLKELVPEISQKEPSEEPPIDESE